MGIRRSSDHGLEILVDAANQRQAYNNFRKARVLYRKIVARTPVLSGALRASWIAGYGVPDYSYVKVGGKKVGMVPVTAPEFGLEYDRDRAWHIFIVNNAPYAKRIENGWSQRAPAGMVRISVLEVYSAFR